MILALLWQSGTEYLWGKPVSLQTYYILLICIKRSKHISTYPDNHLYYYHFSNEEIDWISKRLTLEIVSKPTKVMPFISNGTGILGEFGLIPTLCSFLEMPSAFLTRITSTDFLCDVPFTLFFKKYIPYIIFSDPIHQYMNTFLYLGFKYYNTKSEISLAHTNICKHIGNTWVDNFWLKF